MKTQTSTMLKRLIEMKMKMYPPGKAKEGAEVKAKDVESLRKERVKEKNAKRKKKPHLPQMLQLNPVKTARNLMAMLQRKVMKLWKPLLSQCRKNLIYLLPVLRSRRPVGRRQLPVQKLQAQNPGEGQFLKGEVFDSKEGCAIRRRTWKGSCYWSIRGFACHVWRLIQLNVHVKNVNEYFRVLRKCCSSTSAKPNDSSIPYHVLPGKAC